MHFEVAVIGLGAMGSAAAANCAARGIRVAGIEQFPRGHDLGSFAGASRMIRKAYFEDPAYVPLLLRAYDLWRELEEATGEELLRLTGLLMVGPEGCEIVRGAIRAAQQHSLGWESLDAGEIRARYPRLQLRDDDVGVFETEGGVLAPEKAIAAQLRIAEENGAGLYFGRHLERWTTGTNGFELRFADESRLTCDALILSLGAWFQETLRGLGVPLQVQRNVQAWFTPATADYQVGRFPAFLLERAGLPAPLYGFPDFGAGVKTAFHGHGSLGPADTVERAVDFTTDIAPIQRATNDWMPGAAAEFRAGKVCLYSLSPDAHFVVDRHPEHPQLILCGGFSGHGFKFAPVIGEIAADLALEGKARHEIEFLSLRRFFR